MVMSVHFMCLCFFLCAAQTSFAGMQQPQPSPLLPVIQACVDAITEHQRLNTLMKGELIKGLLPQSSVRADYTVKRVRGMIKPVNSSNFFPLSGNVSPGNITAVISS